LAKNNTSGKLNSDFNDTSGNFAAGVNFTGGVPLTSACSTCQREKV
jgi:hypothetical protein